MKNTTQNIDENNIRGKTRLTIILANIFFTLMAVPGIMVAFKSVILFDSPGSESNPVIIVMFLTVASFPVFVFLSLGSWVLYNYRKYKASVIISFLPFVNIFIVAIITLISMTFFNQNLDWF